MSNEQRTPSSKSLMGVILAAGHGHRMWPFNERYPKPILPVCNRPVIAYQIELMRSLGISDVVILIGHKGYEITKVLGDGRALGVRLQYVEQREMLGIAHAVGSLESVVDKPFMLFLGDIFFRAPRLGEMVEKFFEDASGGVLATKEESDPEAIRRNYSISLSDEGLVTRVIEKPRHTRNSLKGCGLYLFDLTIFDAIRRTPRTAMRNEYELTDAIQVMIDDGYPVRICNVVEEDMNLTNPADLLLVNLREARTRWDGSLVADSAHLARGASIERSVIGANVRVAHPIRICDSVVFDDVVVESRSPLTGVVVTPDRVVDCTDSLGKEARGE
jgi:dTDP-glucose pyrophosphorylase